MHRRSIERVARPSSDVLAAVIATLVVVLPIVGGLGIPTPLSLIEPISQPMGISIQAGGGVLE